MRYTSIFIILIMLLINSCKKDGAGHPHLLGSWKSETSDLTLTFRDGRFEGEHSFPLNPRYLVYKGSYTLDGNNIYLTAEQAEAFDRANMSMPEIVVYKNIEPEHFKFKIIGESVQLIKADKVPGVGLIADGFYTKKY